MLDADQALERLLEGNRRYCENTHDVEQRIGDTRREETAQQQNPFAIILGCSDSRVPAEIVFDQGIGDLFVIRVAGNIVAPSQLGSVEYAAALFGTKLVVVLGHSSCGAIQATLDDLAQPGEQSRGLKSIINRVRPSIEELFHADLPKEKLARHAVRANVRASASHLEHGSAILEDLIANHGLKVVGAEYDLETGRVELI